MTNTVKARVSELCDYFQFLSGSGVESKIKATSKNQKFEIYKKCIHSVDYLKCNFGFAYNSLFFLNSILTESEEHKLTPALTRRITQFIVLSENIFNSEPEKTSNLEEIYLSLTKNLISWSFTLATILYKLNPPDAPESHNSLISGIFTDISELKQKISLSFANNLQTYLYFNQVISTKKDNNPDSVSQLFAHIATACTNAYVGFDSTKDAIIQSLNSSSSIPVLVQVLKQTAVDKNPEDFIRLFNLDRVSSLIILSKAGLISKNIALKKELVNTLKYLKCSQQEIQLITEIPRSTLKSYINSEVDSTFDTLIQPPKQVSFLKIQSELQALIFKSRKRTKQIIDPNKLELQVSASSSQNKSECLEANDRSSDLASEEACDRQDVSSLIDVFRKYDKVSMFSNETIDATIESLAEASANIIKSRAERSGVSERLVASRFYEEVENHLSSGNFKTEEFPDLGACGSQIPVVTEVVETNEPKSLLDTVKAMRAGKDYISIIGCFDFILNKFKDKSSFDKLCQYEVDVWLAFERGDALDKVLAIDTYISAVKMFDPLNSAFWHGYLAKSVGLLRDRIIENVIDETKKF